MYIQLDLLSIGVGLILGGIVSVLLVVFLIRSVLRKQLEENLKERKDQLIALTSHYLLNPITVIQTAITQLQENDVSLTSEQRSKLYDAVVRGQQRLWILAEQFFLVGEVDQGELELKIAVGNVSEMVGDAIAALDSFARGKSLKIKFNDRPQELRETRMDARRMKQAIIAVLDNAIKFSPERGVITVEVGFDSKIFTIAIQDQGIGMPEEVMAHLAEKFTRGSALYNFDYEGIGLGLHVAQAILRLHEGNISFESRSGQGTTVLIQFPNL